jgi:hypothetical protein
MELIADLPSLWGRWFKHRLEEDCRRSNVLASPGEDRGLFTSLVLIDAMLDVTCS